MHQSENGSQNGNFEGKRHSVKIIKEGTNIWLQQTIYQERSMTDKDLDYYLAVEYEVLKRNSLKTLLPVQLREKDGEKSLLFDITGRHSLKEQERSKRFSQKECKNVVYRIIDLLEEIDGYMLNLNCVQFQTEYMYIDINGQIQWIYSPQSFSKIEEDEERKNNKQDMDNEGFQEKIESFFAWMLTQINYEDTGSVRFMYELYDKVRKVGFSKELLEKCMQVELLQESYSESCNIENLQGNILHNLGSADGQYYNGIHALNNIDSQNFEKRKNTDGNSIKNCSIEKRGNRNGGKNINGNISRKNREGLKELSNMGCQTWSETETPNNIGRQGFKELENSESIYKQKRKEINKVDNIGEKKQKNLESSKNKRKTVLLFQCFRIIFSILFVLSLGLEGFFIFLGIQQGFSDLLFRYCVGGAILLLAFLFGTIWSSSKIKKLKKREKFYTEKHDIGKNYEDKYYTNEQQNIEQMNESINRPLTIKTNVDWENEDMGITAGAGMSRKIETSRMTTGDSILRRTETARMTQGTTVLGRTEDTRMTKGTTILGELEEDTVENQYFCPMLQEVDTGIVYIIKNCPFYIGSAIGVNQLEIQDKTVSREHAVILEDLENNCGGYIIRDMNSTNGTWINDKKMKKGGQESLEEGQIIRFAQKEYKFLLQGI